MTQTLPSPAVRETASPPSRKRARRSASPYPTWFYLVPAVIYIGFFLVPTLLSFYFAFTRWDLFTSEWVGLDNFRTFFDQQEFSIGLKNTVIYALITCTLKVVLGLAIAMVLTSAIFARGYLRSVIFFPTLVSTIGIGLAFTVLLNPEKGLVNNLLGSVGVDGPAWLVDPSWALVSVAFVDVWKGLGLATVIYIAGLVSIPAEYKEAARVDGASAWHTFRHVTLPLLKPATSTVILLSFIGGLRSFDLIWAMTKGGPGFTSDVISSVIYKQYQAGYFGLSAAGNVVLFLVVTALAVPLSWYLNRGEVES
ncbi:carbohydrate ABC transporter permease [Streptomyces sp. NPDC090106]|uniref:carbohydrate ABC transporter permease n=1 Tax=Streptomyces sp. NPDC090106 TaxID=3365946 RepID=UPI00380D2420